MNFLSNNEINQIGGGCFNEISCVYGLNGTDVTGVAITGSNSIAGDAHELIKEVSAHCGCPATYTYAEDKIIKTLNLVQLGSAQYDAGKNRIYVKFDANMCNRDICKIK